MIAAQENAAPDGSGLAAADFDVAASGPPSAADRAFAAVEKIAAAILYEGYILYPYRPSAIKNRQRWNFGTLYPRIYAEAQRPQEPCRFTAECLIQLAPDRAPDAAAILNLRLQFLQLLPKNTPGAPLIAHSALSGTELNPGTPISPGAPSFAPFAKGGYAQHPLYPHDSTLSDPSLAWEEAIECNSELHNLSLSDLIDHPRTIALPIQATADPTGKAASDKPDGDTKSLFAELTLAAEPLNNGAIKLHLELQNSTPLPGGPQAKREEALPKSFVSAHLILRLDGAHFLSLLDPPERFREAAARCTNTGVFPVLAGQEPDRSTMLCSPIILYDYPKIAPESEGDFFDGTEMDEMLTLRVLTLTDDEKEQMRNGDPRARRILERTESLTSESIMKTHGVIRGMRDIRVLREELP